MTNLLELRKKHGIKAADLAKMCGVSIKTYNNWEAGRNNMRAHHAITLAEIFGLDAGEIGILLSQDAKVEEVANEQA